jgi:diguanylate cyclase (GGDEF)-like protein
MPKAGSSIADMALEAAGIGGWEFNVPTGVLRWTALTYRIHELDPSWPPRLQDALNFYPPESRPTLEAAIQESLRTGAPWNLDLPFITARGRRLWVSISGRAVRRRGATIKLFGAFADITARVAAEQRANHEAVERRRAEALLRDVLDTLPTAVTAYDADERFVLANAAYAEIFPISASFSVPGRKLEEVLRLSMAHGQYADATTPAEQDAWVAEHLRYFRAATPRSLRLADGRIMQVRERRSPTGTLVTVRSDTTDLHAAEAKARREAEERERAEALLRDVLDALPIAVVVFDADERFVLSNGANAEIAPLAARLGAPGIALADAVRIIAEQGQYVETGATPAEREAWIADYVATLRAASGTPRTMWQTDGRRTQVRERRSKSGNLVIVRTDTTELMRAEALLRDVLDAIPNGVTAYGPDERFILSNRAYIEMFPVAARVAVPGSRYEDVVRYAVQQGQYPEAGETEAEQEAWIARQVAHHRDPRGQRKLRLADGRFILARERRSATGNLVSVRTDTTELMRAEALLRDVLESLPAGVMAYDRDEKLLLWNQAAADLLTAVAPSASVGTSLADMLRFSARSGQYFDVGATDETREQWVAKQLAVYRTPGPARTQKLPDGRFLQARERLSETGNLVCVRIDITELKRAEALLRDVLDALPSGLVAYDKDERLLLANRAYREIFPIAGPMAVPGIAMEEFLRRNARDGQFLDVGDTPEEIEAWVARHAAMLRAPGAPRILKLSDGRFVQALDRRSETGNLVCVRTDTTDLKRAEDDLRLQAERDALTLLANRPAFLASLDRALAGLEGDGGALLLLDVDYFKQINDTLGHDTGDTLLVEIATRLRKHLRASDIAARLGGDEFGVVIPGLTEADALAERMDSIHAALSAPVHLAGRRLSIGLSIGVTVFPADGTDAAKLLKNADLALYEAKRNGRGRWSAFRPEQSAAQEHYIRMADALRDALARGQITVALQPKRLLRGGGHAGFEALARWHDGTGWVPPSEFIPVAEDTGLIGQLGGVVMNAALARIRAIQDLGLNPGRVAVNVTGPQLLDPHFMDDTLAALYRHALRPADLELELTETVLLGRAAERIDGVLREFSRLGVTLSLDDFGTGYASLAHLSRLPIDRLKIDRSFVDGIGGGGPGGVIARTIISLAHSLEMESVAEGIETQEQLAFLEAAGCEAGQGYLFSKPLLGETEQECYLRGLRRQPASLPSTTGDD